MLFSQLSDMSWSKEGGEVSYRSTHWAIASRSTIPLVARAIPKALLAFQPGPLASRLLLLTKYGVVRLERFYSLLLYRIPAQPPYCLLFHHSHSPAAFTLLHIWLTLIFRVQDDAGPPFPPTLFTDSSIYSLPSGEISLHLLTGTSLFSLPRPALE